MNGILVDNKQKMRILFFGFGFSAKATARYMQDNFSNIEKISATIRQSEHIEKLKRQNIFPIFFANGKISDELKEEISLATHIIHSVAPTKQGDIIYNSLYGHLQNSSNLRWICYYSTIGVYGNHDGKWIDERALCQPKNPRSILRLAIEDKWRNFANKNKIKLLILRLAGIYGKNRSVFDKLKNGTARSIIKKGQVFNRIHVKDIGRTTSLAAKSLLSGTYNLCDNEPAPPENIVDFAAKLANIEPPKKIDFDKADMSEMARSFYNDNKRVSNRAIKKALNMELLFPTYREGLRDIFFAD